MKFYSYKGIAPLGQEPLGTSHRRLDELKTVQGVINRNIKRGWSSFTIYSYTNLYDDKTFRKVYQQLPPNN